MNMAEVFGRERAIIGMVHLLPLPGSPRFGGSLAAVIARAIKDARALESGGIDGLMIENYGDAPFTPGSVDPITVAAMTVAVQAVRGAVRIPCGVNVLKNDARSSLAIATATGCRYVRVNIHIGAMVTDQGVIQGDAYGTLRYRQALGSGVKIFADVLAKHGVPIAPVDLEQEARDAAYRGLADALIVSGKGTGEPTDVAAVKTVRAAVPDVPLLVGSGVTPATVAEFLGIADGVIVGSSLKKGRKILDPIDPAKVEALVRAAGR